MRKVIFFLLTIAAAISHAQSLRELYQEGLKAYEQGDYETFQMRMQSIDSMRPNFPAVVYNLAGGYSLTGEFDKSIEVLNKYILMDATQNFLEDKDFANLQELPAFKTIQDKQKELTREINQATTFEIAILSSHPESITYSKKQDAFFIGGVRDGDIWKIEENEPPQVWSVSPKNSWSVMGLEISNDGKTLWVCTSSMNNYENYDQNEDGFASVLKYDVKKGELLETYALPGGHNFGDLIIDDNNNVYVSDGISNTLYWINPDKNKLEVFLDLSDQIFNLQGLTFNDNQDAIYVSDYIDGIYRVDLKSKEASKLKIEANDILIKGIDGLYFEGGSLIGLHNGTKPNRVVRYQLSDDGMKIIGKNIVEQGGNLGEPTQGVWKEDKFYFIMNSPWTSYDKDGNFTPEGENLIIGILD